MTNIKKNLRYGVNKRSSLGMIIKKYSEVLRMKNYALIIKSNLDKRRAYALDLHIPDCTIVFQAKNQENAYDLQFRYLSQIDMTDCKTIQTEIVECLS